MTLQIMLCMGMVLCCRCTSVGDGRALRVHIGSTSAVRFVDMVGEAAGEKTYRHDMEVELDRGVFDRAVRMLGERVQSGVRVEDVEVVLQAMDYLSTGTEREGRIEWSREMFERAVQVLGKRHQCKVAEMEEILHAMDYLCTGRVDMVHVSEYMEVVTEWSKESVVIMWNQETFERAYNILIGKEKAIVGVYDTVEILHLVEYLSIRREWENACYGKLAEKGMDDYRRAGTEAAIGDIENLKAEMVREGRKTRSFELYMQHVLRLSALKHGMCFTVNEKSKELVLRSSSCKKEKQWGTSRNKEWVLRVEMCDEYRIYTEVQRITETLIEVMGIAVDVHMDELMPEDRDIMRRINSRAQETRLSVKCSEMEQIAIAQHMEWLKDYLVELDISWNYGVNAKDWMAVGRMAKLEILNMRNCNIKSGTVARYMQKLDLVELNVSWNDNLGDSDWEAIGKMARLERLNMWDCNTQAGTIARHMEKLNLVELNAAWNESLNDDDWKTIGRMTKLARLDIEDCEIRAGGIARYMRGLNLVELNVTENDCLSDDDWETIGRMAKLEKLDIRGCNIGKEQFSTYLGGLKCHIER